LRPFWRHTVKRNVWSWLAAALCVLLTTAAMAQAPASPSASASVQTTQAQDALEQLRRLSQQAPARQMGQPGEEVIDRYVRERFADAVQSQSPSDRLQQVNALLEEIQRKHIELNQHRNNTAMPQQTVEEVSSPIYVHLTVERPMPTVIIALLVFVMAAAGYAVQKRQGVLIMAGVSLLIAIALPIAARLIDTPYEQALRETRGESAEGSLLEVTARELHALNVKAAQEMAGLWQSGEITYPAAVFQPGQAQLQGPSGSAKLYQMAPNLVDPGNLPDLQFNGPIRYVGEATKTELNEVDVRDAAVIMEFNTYKRWLDVVQLGAKLVIFLEPGDGQELTFEQAADKTTNAPLSLPRFYLKRDDLAAVFGSNWHESLKAGAQASIVQTTPGRWVQKESVINWLFIPADPIKSATISPDAGQQLVHIQTYKDTASIVPELSPGASSAANLVAITRLVAHFEQYPPARPVLISAVTGHTQALQGESEFAHFAFANPDSHYREQHLNEIELARQLYLAQLHDVSSRPLDDQRIEYMRTSAPMVAGQVVKANKMILDTLRGRRNDLRDQTSQALLAKEKLGDAWTQAQEAELKEKLAQIDKQAQSLVLYMKLFNWLGSQAKLSDLSPEQLAELNRIFAGISEEASRKAALIQRTNQRLTDNLAIRRRLMSLAGAGSLNANVSQADMREIFTRLHPPLPAALVLNVDLTFGAPELGFFATDSLIQKDRSETEAMLRMARMSRYTLEVAAKYSEESGNPNLLQDTIRNVGGVPWQGYLGTPLAFGSRMYQLMDLPALTLTTIRDTRMYAYTPWDTVDRINPENFSRTMAFVQGYLPALVDGSMLSHNRRSVGRADSLAVELKVRQQDQFSVSVPQMPVGQALVVIWRSFLPAMTQRTMLADVRPYPILMTDDRGVAVVRGGAIRETTASTYKYDSQFSRIESVLDMGEGAKRFTALIKPSLNETFVSKTLVAFNASKVDIVGLTEPLLLSPVTQVDVLDALQDARPRNFAVVGVPSLSNVGLVPQNADGVASVFVKPTGAFKLRAGLGLLINTTKSDRSGIGFDAQTGIIRNTAVTSATDMWRLTDARLNLLASKGVSNDTAQDFNGDARQYLDNAIAARDAGENEDHLVQAEVARGLAFRAYTRGLTTINDLIKAVVIFLAMVIPFCFFLTKLVSPYTDVNRQLMLFGMVFVAMAVLLWLVHPAFKIASTPAVVVLAFVILGLAIFVAGVLMSRFNSSMNQAVEESLGSESADAPQGRLMGVAFMVGINNMKRRRIRTTLTCVTIVLVTFTMLSVISVGQDVEPARVRMGPETPYSGLLFTRTGLGAIDATQMRRLRAHFEGQAQVAARVWVQRRGAYGDYLPFHLKPVGASEQAAVDAVQAKVIVGMDVIEDGFTGPMPIAAGGRWFSSNDAQEIVLSVQAAALLGITPENFSNQLIDLNGRRLKLIGLLNDERFSEMRDLADLPLSPLLSAAAQDASSTGAETSQASGQESLDGSADLMSAPGIEPARPMDIAIVPLNVARSMPHSNYYTLSIKFTPDAGDTNPAATSEKTIQAARHFIRYQHARLYAGIEHPLTIPETGRTIEAGQYSLTSSSSTQVGGILKVAIPIILAATIILNTMLGSVMERRREVSIYNAIGLNPGHVMVFFLAESLVFGTIGAVAGYLIGQILSMAITYFNIVSLNLNYSSLSVMVVIFLTIATVLLSTVYPAMMAARAAVPSGQRRWALPQPQGDEIFVQFPFCYDANRVKGVCAYLREFMHQNSEASTGQFLARLGPVGTVPARAESGSEDATNYAMLFDIAPAPFDLGVNQKMEVYAYYDPHVKAHMLAVYLRRTSGETSNWKTVNQPFLESLRKRLLGWRSQRPETHQAYYRQGEQMFANAAPLPVLTQDIAADSSQGGR